MRLSHLSTLVLSGALLLPIAARGDNINSQLTQGQTPVVVQNLDSSDLTADQQYQLQEDEQLQVNGGFDQSQLNDESGDINANDDQPVDLQPVDDDNPVADGGNVAATPEPSSLALLGTATLGLGGVLRRRQVAG